MQTSESSLTEPLHARVGPGWVMILVMLLAILWVAGNAILAQFASFILDQALIDGSAPVPDVRALLQLGSAILQLVPLILLTLFVNNPAFKRIFRGWLLAAIFVLLLVPARLAGLTQEQGIEALQVGGMIVFIVGVWWWAHRGHLIGFKFRSPAFGLGIACAALLSISWVVWGAAGSFLDTLLGLADGILFGISAALVLWTMLAVTQAEPGLPYSSRSLVQDGIFAAITLMIMVTGLGQTCGQWLLALTIPILGWAAATLMAAGKDRPDGNGWSATAILIGVAAALPLIWYDGDELSFVISGGTGDLMSWAIRSVLVSFVLGAGISIALAVYLPRLKRIQWSRLAKVAVPAAGWLAAVIIFVLLGRPGFYGERLFVIMKDQVNLSATAKIVNPMVRRQVVYTQLVQEATKNQAGLRSYLDRLGIPYKPYYLVNALEIRGGPLVRLWLESRPDVDRVLDNPILRPLPAPIPPATGSEPAPTQPQWNLTMIGADKVWAMGITGKGIVVGQSDSGVQYDHPEIADAYRGKNGDNNYNWFDPWYGTTRPNDFSSHGTHTLGTILGKRVGVAPGATWIGCANLARNLGNPGLYLDCWQFMLAPFPQDGDPFTNAKPDLGANVLNNSWGCPTIEGCDANTFLQAVRALKAAGVFVVVSAGNSGLRGCDSLTDPPATYAEVLSVGAVSEAGNLANFSSIGPVTVDGSNRVKPDLVAPGEDVLSSVPNNAYALYSGTSMAGPHVVGTVALMWSANPKLIGDVQRTQELLEQTATPYSGSYPTCLTGKTLPNDAVGYGLLNAFAAVQKAIEVK